MPKRILLTKGTLPVIVVAPHGYQLDDQNTDVLADAIAAELNAYSVINVGWRRAKNADLAQGIANLNSLKHCQLSPVKEEFIDQILFFRDEILLQYKNVHVLYIHGMSNEVRSKTKDSVDIVVGYGQGTPPSYSCGIPYKTALITRLTEQRFNVYQGKEGGKFSAWSNDNLNQLFRQHLLDQRVQSIQLEIVNVLRVDVPTAIQTGKSIARAFSKMLHNSTAFYKNVEIKEY